MASRSRGSTHAAVVCNLVLMLAVVVFVRSHASCGDSSAYHVPHCNLYNVTGTSLVASFTRGHAST